MTGAPRRVGAAVPGTLGLALILMLVAGCATAPEPPAVDAGLSPVVSYARDYVANAAEGVRKGGLGVVVVADGKPVLVEGFGYADEASDTPVGPETVFRFGSISKLFTTLSVMQLVEQGLVDLDKPYRNYVPEFTIQTRDAYAPITVRNLLTHHAGLPGDIFKGWAAGSAEASGWDTRYRETIDLLAREYATAPPETAFSYSNAGFSLLAILIERVSGTDYVDYVDRNIFEPLGMASAGFLPGEGGSERLATGYPGGDLPPNAYTYLRDLPAGSVFAGLTDMARFMEMLVAEGAGPDGTRILAEETFSRMAEPQNEDVARDLDFRIGLTFWLVNPTTVPDAGLMSHGGDIPPFHAVLTSAPGEDAAVLTVTNSDEGAGVITDAAIEIMQRLLEERRGRRFEVVALPERAEVPIDAETASEVRGYWSGPIGLMEADTRRGRLRLDTSVGTLTGVHRGNGYLSAEFRLLGIPIVQLHPLYLRLHDLAGEPVLGFYQQGILMGYAVRHHPEPVPEVWQRRAGRYEIVNPDPVSAISDPEIHYDEKTGLFSVTVDSVPMGGSITLPLRPVSDDLAVTAGYGRLAGEALQVRREGGQERFYYSGFEVRKVE
ncbi:MAG: serine hydrolase domain-containing protein [bacterium]